MGAAMYYIRGRSGAQRLCSESELEAYQAEGWFVERKVEQEKAPAKKVAAKKKAAPKKAK